MVIWSCIVNPLNSKCRKVKKWPLFEDDNFHVILINGIILMHIFLFSEKEELIYNVYTERSTDVYMHHCISPSLVQMMACHRFEPMH